MARRCAAAASRGSVSGSLPRRRTGADARGLENPSLTIVAHHCPHRFAGHHAPCLASACARQRNKPEPRRARSSARSSPAASRQPGPTMAAMRSTRRNCCVSPPKSEAVATDQSADEGAGQGATASADTTGLRIRYAQIEAAFDGLKIVLDAERRRAEELRTERDRWAAQAERLALPAPQHRRGFAGWLKRA